MYDTEQGGAPVPNWRFLHHAALQQNDLALLLKLSYELEAAIVHRLHELAHQPGRIAERAELRSAVTDLNSIRTGKLGWPDPRKFFGP